MTLGACIRLLRGSAGLKQHELAKRVGISASMLSLIETDKRDPTIADLRVISRELGVPANVLFAVALGDDDDAKSEAANKLRSLAEQLVASAQQAMVLARFRRGQTRVRKKGAA